MTQRKDNPGGSCHARHSLDLAGWRIEWTEGERLALVTAPTGTTDHIPVTEYAWTDDDLDIRKDTPGPTLDDLGRTLVEHIARSTGLPAD